MLIRLRLHDNLKFFRDVFLSRVKKKENKLIWMWNDFKGQSKGQIYNSKTNCDGF